MPEQPHDFRVRGTTELLAAGGEVDGVEGPEQGRHRELVRLPNLYGDEMVGIRVDVQPGAFARDDLRAIEDATGKVNGISEVDAGRAGELADHAALGAVNNEGAVLGHDREFPEVDLGLLDLSGAAVVQPHPRL